MTEGNCDNSTCKAVPNINCNEIFCKEPKNFICFSKCLSSTPPTTLPANCRNFFICKNREIIIASSFCDGKPDCSDSSDEIQNQFGFKCQGSREFLCVLPQDNLHDSDTPQCFRYIDVLLDKNKNEATNRFTCLDSSYEISIHQVCDNIVDCSDLSDECLCPINLHKSLCKTRFENSNVTVPGHYSCGAVNTDCSDFQSIYIKETACASANVVSNVNSETKIQCQAKYRMVVATRCDNIPECSDFSDECSGCSPEPEFCKDKCHTFYPMGDRYCDGYEDSAYSYSSNSECGKGFDEKETYCKRRFHCKAGIQVSIPNLLVGDGVIDCDDGTDEADQFSSSTKMIRDDAISAFMWIIAIVTLGANAYVIYNTCHLLRNKKMLNLVRVNYVLILNLSIADFIMGIYLLIISIKNLQFMGIYGLVDLKWRSGVVCTLSGALAIISSETSCFILSTLTTFRLITVLRPVKSCTSSIKPWFVVIAVIWLFSIVLAVLPSLDALDNYFVYQLYLNVPFAKNRPINKSDALDMSCRYASIFNKSFIPTDDWQILIPHLKTQFNTTVKKISYYGETSFCMPRFYAHKNNSASEFSIFIISLNFISFVYVCVSYIFIYKVTSNQPVSNKQVDIQNAKMQKRIARLLLTDFVCWIPICVIAFAKHVTDFPLTNVIYAITIAFLLPVNSALNPLLYTSFFDKIFDKIQKLRRKPIEAEVPSAAAPTLPATSEIQNDVMTTAI